MLGKTLLQRFCAIVLLVERQLVSLRIVNLILIGWREWFLRRSMGVSYGEGGSLWAVGVVRGRDKKRMVRAGDCIRGLNHSCGFMGGGANGGYSFSCQPSFCSIPWYLISAQGLG